MTSATVASGLRTIVRMLRAEVEIARLRAAGVGWGSVARQLNRLGVPTPSGRGRWYGSSALRLSDRDRWAAYMRDYRARRRG